MGGRNHHGYRGVAAALLLTVQLCAVLLAPVLHRNEPATDHIEAPGTHPGGHSEAACVVCRHADARFLPTLAVRPATTAGAAPVDDAAPARSVARTAPLQASRAARAPPALA